MLIIGWVIYYNSIYHVGNFSVCLKLYKKLKVKIGKNWTSYTHPFSFLAVAVGNCRKHRETQSSSLTSCPGPKLHNHPKGWKSICNMCQRYAKIATTATKSSPLSTPKGGVGVGGEKLRAGGDGVGESKVHFLFWSDSSDSSWLLLQLFRSSSLLQRGKISLILY